MSSYVINSVKNTLTKHLFWRGFSVSTVRAMDHRPYDIVVYGATGYTGKFVAAEAFRTRNERKIAIAGRNKTKLESVLDFVKKETGGEDVHSQIGVIVANSSDNDSILEMCRQSKVLVNCVGPYALYGEQVVKACVETATHHLDISGEPQFLQMCQLKYHEEAKKKGIHIIGTCGFDSVPADVGLETLRDRFPGELTYAKSFIRFFGPGQANTGTWDSAVHAVSEQNIIREQTKAIFHEKLQYVGPREKMNTFGWNKSLKKYYIPFFGPDASVVKRTQLFESKVHGKTPIQYHAYLTVPSLIRLFFMMIIGTFVVTLSKFQWGLKLLTTYPRLFSFGFFSPDGPKRENLNKTGFKITFNGQGYDNKPGSSDKVGKPTKSMSLTLQGPDPGYIYTSASMIAAANTILEDTLPNEGGVLTPGSAFRGTRFLDRLQERGLVVQVS